MISETVGRVGAGVSRSGVRAYASSLVPLSSRRRIGLPRLDEIHGPAVCVRRDALFRRALLTADVVGFVVAFALLVGVSSRPQDLTWASFASLPALLVYAKVTGLYDRDEALMRKTTLDEAPKLFQLAAIYVVIAWLAGGVIGGHQLDRLQALFLWLALASMLILARSLARALALRVAPTERCLVIGDETSIETIRSKLHCRGGVKATVVAHLSLDETAPWTTDTFSVPKISQIRDMAQSLDVHRAIIAPGSGLHAESHETLDIVRTLNAVGIRVSVLPRMLEVVGSSVEFDDLHGVTLMGVGRFGLTRSSAWLKRGFDLLGAAIGLAAIFPLMLAIAVAIKLDGRGPLFFRQLRVGRHGRHFQMLKFRTMGIDADARKELLRERNEAQEGLFKITTDPRVTRVGGFLRRTALDELPQLLNVIKGEMSLVGPRPLVVDEDEKIDGWHRRRLEVMPGMTGPWQILGPARVPLKGMVAMDYLYVATWSLWTDIKILLRTVAFVAGRRGL